MEIITVFMENIMANKTCLLAIGLIALIAPLYFAKTVHAVWFGSEKVFYGFHSQKTTWLIMAVVDFVGFLSTLPARENGRVIQAVMALWTIEMIMVYMATVARKFKNQN